jgi:hypothetical protein
MYRNVGKKLRPTCCVITQKSEVLFYFAAAALNHTLLHIYLRVYVRSNTGVYHTAHVTYLHSVWKRMVVFGRLRLEIYMLHYIISQRKGGKVFAVDGTLLTFVCFTWQQDVTLENTTLAFFLYFLLWPTNAHLFHKLSHSYMFRPYRVILRELSIFNWDIPVVFQ